MTDPLPSPPFDLPLATPGLKATLRVLMVEDSQDDALLILRELRRFGFDLSSQRVESAVAMRAALCDQSWDLILSDYVIPGFGGLEALLIAQQNGIQTPFILLSNKVSEETLVEAMRLGASDFIMKDHLSRLGPAVRRELADALTRQRLSQVQVEWRTALDAVQDAIFVHAPDFRIVRANLAYAALAKLPIADVIGKVYWQVFPKLDGPLPSCANSEERRSLVEERVTLESGEIFTSRSFSIKDESGAHAYSVHVMQNMTERSRSETALRLSEARYRSFVELTDQYAWVTAADGSIVEDIPLWRALTGQSQEQVKGRGWNDVVHPDDRERAANAWRDALAHTSSYEVEYRALRRDGVYRDLLVRGVPVRDSSGRLHEWVGTAIDVTEQTRERRRTAALLELAVSEADLDEKSTLQNGLDVLQQLTASQIGFAHFVSEDQNEIELITWSTDTLGCYCQATFDSHYPVSRAGLWADCVRSKQAVMVNDYATASGKKGLPQGHSALLRFISVPVFEQGLVRMVVGIGNAPIHYTEGDVETVKLFATDLFRLVQRKRAQVESALYVKQLQTAFMETVELATKLSEMRDPYTHGHERRVADIAVAIGSTMGFESRRLEGLKVAGLLHDVGKNRIPVEILSRPGKLSAAEFLLIKEHARAGYNVLKDVKFPWPVAEITLQHHERMDGSGYPQGLKGEAILIDARILAVADTVEAMSSHRPYRAGRGIDKALAEIELESGRQFDSVVADACLRLFREKGYVIPD